MKKYFLLLLGLSTMGLLSCSKKDPLNPPAGDSPTTGKIKSWAGTTVSNYSYDGSGRCTQIENSNGSKIAFEYLPGKMIQKQYTTSGINDVTFEYTLDANGLALNEKRTSTPGYTGDFIFNNESQVVKKIYLINGQNNTIDYFYSNGNCDSSRHMLNGSWHTSILYTYYTGKPNTIGHASKGRFYLGKDNKNLLHTEQYTYPDGSILDPVVFTYEFDASGKVVKQTNTQSGNLHISYLSYY